MLRPLAFHEGLTVVVGWDKGFVKEPGTSDLIGQFLASNWPLFIPDSRFPVHVLAVVHARARPARRPGRRAVRAAGGNDPAEAGTLVDENAAMRDITATIVDLAVRGYIVIEEKEKSEMMGLLHNKEYVFHLKKRPQEWAGLKAHELRAARGNFFEWRANRRGAFQPAK